MNPRINVGKGVTGAVRYVLGEGRDPKTALVHGRLIFGQIFERTANNGAKLGCL
jgi:hypothetical protein